MNKTLFEECLKHYKSEWTLGETWESLAIKYGYPSKYSPNGEKLRWVFKAERIKRGILGKSVYTNGVIRKTMDKPRVAILDIETLPGMAYFWRLYDDNTTIEQVVADTCLLGWAGKFLNEPDIFSDILTPEEATKRASKRVAESCWNFLSQADVVIGHNFAGFDLKHLNTAFLQYGLLPLKFKVVDTLIVAKQNFAFDSNKLKFINQKLGIRGKIDNDGFPLWKACHEGDKGALFTMQEYNIGDVYATEELFYKFRPYIRNFNVAVYNELLTEQCPVCGSEKLKSIGFYFTDAGKWESVRCEDCGCVSRGKENFLSKEKRKLLKVNS